MVAGTGRVTVGLIGGPLAADAGAAPALAAVLDARVLVKAAVARLPALGDGQGWITVGVNVDVEDGHVRVLDVAAHVGSRWSVKG